MTNNIAHLELSPKNGRPIDLRLPHDARELLQKKANEAGETVTRYTRGIVLRAILSDTHKNP